MAEKVRRGTCKLCLLPAQQLRDSHYIPKGVYRALRADGDANPHPVILSVRGAAQTSRQSRAHLLCGTCEGLLDKNGEDWVLKHFLRADGSFKLETLLQRQSPLVNDEGKHRFYLAAGVPGIDIAALSYFAMSVFWRGSIHPWNADGSVPVSLGSYREPLRRYLHGEAAFPNDMALHMYVRDANNLSKLMLEPTTSRFDGAWAYRFVVPGLMFVLYVGKAISTKVREYCFVRGADHPLVVTTEHEPYLEDLARRLLQATPHGRSGRRAK